MFLLLGAIPKFLSFIFFLLGSLWLIKNMSPIALKPYDNEKDSGDASKIQDEL